MNPISLVGAVCAVLGALLFLVFLLLDWFGLHTNPYMGLVTFIALPALFIFGLLIIPMGYWRDRRRRQAGLERRWPRIDLNNPRQRNVAFFLLGTTLVNVLIVSLAAYSGVHYMDKSEFC